MSRLLIVAFDVAESSSLAGFADALGIPFDLLLLSAGVPAPIGAEKVFLAGMPSIPVADAMAKALARFAAPYTHVAAVSSMRSKDILARTAGVLDAAMVTDAVEVLGVRKFKRPVFAGTVMATVEVAPSAILLTVRPAGFEAPEPAPNGPAENVVLDADSMAERSAVSARSGGRPDLTQAKVIVSGGRPLKDAATFERVVGGLADALGGAVGATRAAVDSGIAPNELQVGQTGKIVAPDLYIAAGISGSTQHMAGIKDSKVIVAINKDPDAPIFEAADLGLVADLYEAIPELLAKVKS